jgi:hypothetical protein
LVIGDLELEILLVLLQNVHLSVLDLIDHDRRHRGCVGSEAFLVYLPLVEEVSDFCQIIEERPVFIVNHLTEVFDFLEVDFV